MEDIAELIKYHQENEYLDFKLEEYVKAYFPALLIDVLSFANANYNGDRFIIFGVKKKDQDIVIQPIESKLDSANIQQLIRENITPELKVDYFPYDFEGNNLMVLQIHEPKEQPYSFSKDIQEKGNVVFKKNEMFIRKGSHNLRISPQDLDRIYKKRYAAPRLDEAIDLSFPNGSKELTIKCLRNVLLPSDREAVEILAQIGMKEQLLQDSPKLYVELYAGNNRLGLPLSALDLSVLRSRLSAVKTTNEAEDKYHLEETLATKINFDIRNNGEMHLEKGLVIVKFPVVKGLTVVKSLALKTYQMVVPAALRDNGYPEVKMGKDVITVTQEIPEVRHQLATPVFKTDIRVTAAEELSGQSISIFAQVMGANISRPREFELRLKIT